MEHDIISMASTGVVECVCGDTFESLYDFKLHRNQGKLTREINIIHNHMNAAIIAYKDDKELCKLLEFISENIIKDIIGLD